MRAGVRVTSERAVPTDGMAQPLYYPFDPRHAYASRRCNVTGCPRKMLALPAGMAHEVVIDGPGCVDYMWLCFNSIGGTPVSCIRELANHADFYRNIWIKVWFDGIAAPFVNVPFADFFLFGHGVVENISNAYFDVLVVPPVKRKNPRQGSFNVRIKMLFRKCCRIAIENRNPIDIRLEAQIHYRRFDAIAEPIYYFAALFAARTVKDEPFEFVDIRHRRGFFWGLGLNGLNDNKDNRFYEAPEHFVVDGDEAGEVVGTGGEVFFGAAWGFRSLSQGPLFGVVHTGQKRPFLWSGRANPRGNFSVYRFLGDAPIPFRESLRGWFAKANGFDQPQREISGAFRAVAYCYLAAPGVEPGEVG
jgi:hypothetical protein